MAQVQRKVCLIVIDGWGISENKEGDKFLLFALYLPALNTLSTQPVIHDFRNILSATYILRCC